MSFLQRKKKIITILLSIIIFIGYFIITDPDVDILKNMNFGVQLVLIFSIFALAMPIIAFLEVHTDIYTDELVVDQEKTTKKASEGSTGAGLMLVSKAIVLLSYSIIIAAIIISVKDII